MRTQDSKNSDNLFETILELRTKAEAKLFFRDLLTEEEIAEFSNRWQAAQMLDRKVPYSAISHLTGLSSRTIARISQWLTKGMGGYRLMIDRLHHTNSSARKGLD
jgi:TrpR-related protein YerC/YecD